MPVSINGTTGIIDAYYSETLATTTSVNIISAVRLGAAGNAPFRINHTDGGGRVNISWNVNGSNTSTGTYVNSEGANRILLNGSNGIQFLNAAAGTAGAPITWITSMIIDTAGRVGIGATPTAHQLQLTTDSAGKPGTNTWTIVSDERLKTNILSADTDRCYDIIKQLPLKRYTWKDEIYSQEQVSDRSKLGWIAQDVQTVFPKGVTETAMTFSPSGLSANEITINDCLSLNADQIYAAMYGAIQKLINVTETQSVIISSLETRIATLEAS